MGTLFHRGVGTDFIEGYAASLVTVEIPQPFGKEGKYPRNRGVR
ncbi:MAG: hypothetical protein K0S36_2021 [Nitrosospira multiformis]|jgi:hypothetical protein|nr:hypothetical protein [Nitrosospira multiformis]